MKRYLGVTSEGKRKIYVVEDGGEAVQLEPVTRVPPSDWRNPIAWGFAARPGRGGNSVRNAAFTILRDLVGMEAAEQHYHLFAEQVMGQLPKLEGFELREPEIWAWIDQHIEAA